MINESLIGDHALPNSHIKTWQLNSKPGSSMYFFSCKSYFACNSSKNASSFEISTAYRNFTMWILHSIEKWARACGKLALNEKLNLQSIVDDLRPLRRVMNSCENTARGWICCMITRSHCAHICIIYLLGKKGKMKQGVKNRTYFPWIKHFFSKRSDLTL